MNIALEPLNPSSAPASPEVMAASASADRWMTELHALLRELEAVTSASETLPPMFSEAVDDKLVQVRLGAAAGLFAALQCKNAATAGHALRVALTCSAWAVNMELPDAERDALEVAALLHDIGVIGAPDRILRKAGSLDPDEAIVMAQARKMSLDILRRSRISPQALEIVEHISTRYGGKKADDSAHSQESQSGLAPVSGRRIPRGSRMIAIVEAFDAMTTDHVYRPARSEERAVAELYTCAGTQFDPDLVRRFDEFRRSDRPAQRWATAHRWLRSLGPAVASAWDLSSAAVMAEPSGVDALFRWTRRARR